MKKVLVSVLLIAMLLCSVSIVNAATADDVIAALSKTYTIAGEKVTVTGAQLDKARAYFNENEVSAENCDSIIAQINDAVALMEKAGTADPSKLSSSQKEELLGMYEEAVSLAGATFDAEGNVVGPNGKNYGPVNAGDSFVRTGNNNVSYVIISAVAVIAIATVVSYRRMRVNA